MTLSKALMTEIYDVGSRCHHLTIGSILHVGSHCIVYKTFLTLNLWWYIRHLEVWRIAVIWSIFTYNHRYHVMSAMSPITFNDVFIQSLAVGCRLNTMHARTTYTPQGCAWILMNCCGRCWYVAYEHDVRQRALAVWHVPQFVTRVQTTPLLPSAL